jgi:diguanylate cyclase
MKHRALSIFTATLFWVITFCVAPHAVAQDASRAVLVLQDQTPTIDAWPHASVLFDEKKTLTIDEVMALSGSASPLQTPSFKPTNSHSALGVRTEAVWLRMPLMWTQNAKKTPERWVVDIDFPVLNQADFYLTRNGNVVQSAKLGNTRPFEARPLASRAYALALELEPAQRYELFMRIETKGPMILPLNISKEHAYQTRALGEQVLQGLLFGVGLCLILYSFAQAIIMREPLFMKYTVLVTGGVIFVLLQFGIGAQYLWTNNFWIEQHIGSLSGLMATCGSFLFIEQALAGARPGRLFSPFMKAGAWLCAAIALVYAFDLINTGLVTRLIGLIAFIPAILAAPRAVYLARQRDLVGTYLLVAWFIYTCFTLVFVRMLQGNMPVNFWTLHAFQFGSILEMLGFMLVLSLRAKSTRLAANRASRERDIMRSLAHTDALTGLANRRRLDEALQAAAPHTTAESLLAIYVIDIDGFKPVNDQYGHDTGDELLIAVARRLQTNMRSYDLVARFGGDEFVILAQSLPTARQAHELGVNLISVFNEPFLLGQNTVRIGLTIGYAIGPQDAQDATTLFKLADAAMYQGKQDGKHCLRRAQAAIPRFEARDTDVIHI